MTTTTITTMTALSAELTRSLRRPGRKTLALIEKALGWLRPFEAPGARTVSAYERRELLDLLDTHRPLLSPYIDTDMIEANLRRSIVS